MKYYFSIENGFQNDEIHSILPDAIELTEQEHELLIKGQDLGKNIVFDINNRPVLQDSPEATFQEVKQLKLDELNRSFEYKVGIIKSSYSLSEVQTWDKQETEARNYLLDTTVQTPLLSALAAARGILLGDLVSKVIVKADSFTNAIGTLIGIRQKLEKEIIAATTIEEFDLIISEMTGIIITNEDGV